MRPFIRTDPVTAGPQPGLTREAASHLATIATRLRITAHTELCTRGEPARYVYNVVDGVACAQRRSPAGDRQILAFLFPGDLAGLAHRSRYVNTVETLTPATVLRIPIDQLVGLVSRDMPLAWTLLCKLTHTLREAQHRALLVSHPEPTGRVAMFLAMMEGVRASNAEPIRVPVPLTDLAEYMSLSRSALLKAFAQLQRDGVIVRAGHRLFRVIDRDGFDRLVHSDAPLVNV
jgi:CRP-like cAMP-binding protein